MNRVLLVFAAVFALVARSDGSLKCYMCDSLRNPSCTDPVRDQSMVPIECNTQAINEWTNNMRRNEPLGSIASFFSADEPSHYSGNLLNAACSKTNLRVLGADVVIRGCQSKKTETVDPCAVLSSKLKTSAMNAVTTMEYCGLCDGNGCNGAIGQSPPRMYQLLLASFGIVLFQAIRQRIS